MRDVFHEQLDAVFGDLATICGQVETAVVQATKALLEAALSPPDAEDDDEEMAVREEDQKSLAVGIIGAPNAGKSALTNFMV